MPKLFLRGELRAPPDPERFYGQYGRDLSWLRPSAVGVDLLSSLNTRIVAGMVRSLSTRRMVLASGDHRKSKLAGK